MRPIVILCMVCLNGSVLAQSYDVRPRTYVVNRISVPLAMDGMLGEAAWQNAPWTAPFVDILGTEAEQPYYETRAKMLWDEQYLYIAARLEEPHLWATIRERDAVIFYDNDFEVFIDPDGDTHHYYELEVNALGTVWDLMLTHPYRNGGQPIDAWDIRGLEMGIGLDGTLNDPTDTDSAWTIELAIPMDVLSETANGGSAPSAGDQWRINFSRVQWHHVIEDGHYVKKQDTTGRALAEENWVWSPQGVINMHYPERWGMIQFAGADSFTAFEDQPAETVKWYLRELYYRQHAYFDTNGSYTTEGGKLDADSLYQAMELRRYYPQLESPEVHITPASFTISLYDAGSGERWFIREDSSVWSVHDPNQQ